MRNQKLLTEYFALCENGVCQDLLTEAEKALVKTGVPILTGVIQRANTKNQNGRIYKKNILEREVEKYQELVKTRRALGECDHPAREILELKSVSHLVREIWWNGDDLMGKCEILSTPQGQIVRALINDGVPLGISSRGVGSVRESKEGIIVEDDFQLLAFDLVFEPSVQGAFQRPIQSESKETLRESKLGSVDSLLDEILRKH